MICWQYGEHNKNDCVLQTFDMAALIFYNCAINTITQGTVTNKLNADYWATKQYSINTGDSIPYCNNRG